MFINIKNIYNLVPTYNTVPKAGEHSAAAMATTRHLRFPFASSDIGICVRDSEGMFVLAKAVIFLCMYSIDVGEALRLHSVM